MPDTVLLRFRDLTEGVHTVDEHNKIVDQHGRVLWGWWKKPAETMPDPGLTIVSKDLKEGEKRVLFVDSGDESLFTAPLLRIHYEPGGKLLPPPNTEHCPDYYERKELPAWFEVGRIERIGNVASVLTKYVFSSENRTASHYSIAALNREVIGQTVADVQFLDSNVSLWLVTPTDDVGLLARPNIVRPVDSGIWKTKGRFILHISDLHFGDEHAFRNHLASAPKTGKERMLDALLADLPAAGIGPDDVALVFATGDFTWRGESHEFANAESFLVDLANALGLHRSQLLIVPGNHDIEWRSNGADIDENAELNYSRFTSSFYNASSRPDFLRLSRFDIGGRTFTIVALNSCRIESKTTAGLGFVGQSQIHAAYNALAALPADAGDIRLCLMHHHLLPINYVEEVPTADKHVSISLDAEAILRFLISTQIQSVFHGHQHQPYYAEVRRVADGFVHPIDPKITRLDGNVSIVGGGSLGVKRGHLNMVGRNSYNILDASDSTALVVRTRLQSPVGPGFTDFQEVRIPIRS
jgi:predicted phosphodiesterase